ncbi:orotate phosphoribosyltransferase [Photorhabdus sp. RM71S]|uniref:orotate phosphoribosyltransferase n=1 Tax=Photorhabdus sp. RM71S TaxID=3342824 RepID=UPI0036DEEB44
MLSNQNDFAQFLIESDVVQFGNFELKSGRISPYFFNFGKLCNSTLLNKTAWFYAKHIVENNISPSVIFGPAYKGIPLCVAISLSLQRDFDIEVDYSFNRKEVKKYGDGGIIVGANLDGGNIIIVDDVITSGMTIDDSVNLVSNLNGNIMSYIVALDREEKGLVGNGSALRDAAERTGVNILPITTIRNIIDCMSSSSKYKGNINKVEDYLSKYGAIDL